MRSVSWLSIAGVAVLLVQTGLTYGLGKAEFLPQPPPLSSLPSTLGPWVHAGDGVMEKEILEVLGADDLLNRFYRDPATQSTVGMFAAYYRTQLRARNAHDPKVCLPGGGWAPQRAEVVQLQGASGDRFEANYFVVAKGSFTSVVIYWYQTSFEIYAREQLLKASRLWNNILRNRTDMALVRIVVPVDMSTGGLAGATQRARSFASQVQSEMVHFFPPELPGGQSRIQAPPVN